MRPLDDRGQRQRARGAGHFPPLVNQRQRWDAANIETPGQALLGLCVELGQPHARLQPDSRRFKVRRHLAARTTPRRPKINQQRNVA